MNPRDDHQPDSQSTPGPDVAPGRELATVHRLPVPHDGPVVDGELVTDAEYRRLTSQKAQALARYQGYRRDVVAVAVWTRRAVTHARTKTVARAVLRNVLYVPAGVAVVVRRVWEAKTNSRYERLLRSAEAAGDHEALLEWESRAEQAKARRHARVMDWIASPWQVAKAVAVIAVTLLMLLVGLGVLLAVAAEDPARVVAPISEFLAFVAWTVWAVSIVWGPLVLAAPWLLVLWLWHVGRTKASVPQWMAPAAEQGDGRDVVPDEGAILNALRNLNSGPLNKKFKEGWQPRWVQPTGRDGKGWRTQLLLPEGVTVAMINDKKDVLAHNLVRLPVEVWPTEPKAHPGVLDLWVADQGLLTGPVDPYPLLTEGTGDYFRGVPVGIDQRGDEVYGRCMACNYAVAGTMGSGKTSLVICLLCGVMLDPLVDIDVYVMADNVDYDAMRPRLRTLVKGDDEVTVPAAIEALRELRSMVSQRGRILAELGGEETKLTRAIAEQDDRMRPRVVVVDECQELFMHDKLGEEAKGLAIKLMMKARKVGITLVWVTPAPSADSLPRALAKTVSHRVCFAIGDHQGNDAILGTGAHKRGITAVNLVPGEDVGTAMAAGFGPRPGLLRTHHIRKEKGIDEITPIVHRALALREQAGVTSPPGPVAAAEQALDPLADIATVLAGQTLVPIQEVLNLLVRYNSAAYTRWTFADLRSALPDPAKPYKTRNGSMHVNADRVAKALATRDTESVTESDEPGGDG